MNVQTKRACIKYEKLDTNFLFKLTQGRSKDYLHHSKLAWQHDPSTFISIGVVGGVLAVLGLEVGALLIVSFSKTKKLKIGRVF